MRFLKIFLLLSIIFLAGCDKKPSEVVIKGKIISEIPFSVFHTNPINETSFFPFKEKIIPDSLGNFQIKLPIEKSTFIKIVITKKDGLQQIKNASLILEPEKEYVVNFNLTKKNKEYEIGGFNETANKQLNTLAFPSHIQEGASPFFKDTITQNIISEIDSLKRSEILEFKALYKKDSISKGFLELVELDRAYYYNSLKGTVGFVKFLMSKRDEKLFNDDIKTMWASCFKNDLLTQTDFQNTAWGYAFIENYLHYKDYESVGFDAEKFKSSIDENQSRITYQIHKADSILPKERLEFYKASFLFDNLIQKNYEEELISAFDDFKKDYPNSSYKKHLAPYIDKVITFHESTKNPFNKDTKFLEDYASINSFEEVLKPLKGKKLYVDFWATWCAPCKQEFKHKKELKVLLEKYDYEALYISTDDENRHQQWLDMIKFYDLTGYHIRANKMLSESLFKMGIKFIPRYFLVDENGEVTLKKVRKPSQLKALEEQLKNN